MRVARYICVLALLMCLAAPVRAGDTAVAAGQLVYVPAIPVTAAFDGFFYIEADNRVVGIRVVKAGHAAVAGDRVGIIGRIQAGPAGDRYLAADSVTVIEHGTAPAAIGVNNLSLGGWSWRWVKNEDGTWHHVWASHAELQNGLGPFSLTQDLLVKTWGHVTYVEPDGSCVYIDDGSHLTDYAETRTGVKAYSPGTGVTFSDIHVGDFLALTAINTVYPDPTAGDPLPLLLVPRASDIQVIRRAGGSD